ncbi:hypothetical protein BJ165DRAFT_1458594 [Panaeolus papilionaceus]|nr:hypothetical protein BJ165DRAFT_1458594 [Panaeolus papilionaceus]
MIGDATGDGPGGGEGENESGSRAGGGHLPGSEDVGLGGSEDVGGREAVGTILDSNPNVDGQRHGGEENALRTTGTTSDTTPPVAAVLQTSASASESEFATASEALPVPVPAVPSSPPPPPMEAPQPSLSLSSQTTATMAETTTVTATEMAATSSIPLSQTLSIQDISEGLLDEAPADPPPPYPTPRRTRSRRGGDQTGAGAGRDGDGGSRRSSRRRRQEGVEVEDSSEAEPEDEQRRSARGSPRVGYPHSHSSAHGHPPTPHHHHPTHAHANSPSHHPHASHHRPHSISHASTMSAAPSLAQTVLSLFNTEDDVCLDDESESEDEGGIVLHGEDRHLLGVVPAAGAGDEAHQRAHAGEGDDADADADTESLSVIMGRVGRQRKGMKFGDRKWWKRYFRPLKKASYYRPLLHLAAINFPYALAAWIYLVVFTVVGTTLLVALPLGALLCFFNLIGARLFSRGELALQARFHPSLALVSPYPPRPIFTRWREATDDEVEAGQGGSTPQRLGLGIQRRNGIHMVKEKSFYKNSYAMFTDPTSYQALFYFIVIKPAITLLITLFIIVLVIPSFVLVVPAPAMLRAVRRIGVWQAGVAIEGLYLAVR